MLEVRGVVSAHPAEAQSVVPLKHVAQVNLATLDETTDPDHAFDYVDISSVAPDVGIARRERLTFGTAPSRARRTVARGDTIVSTVRTYLRAVAFVDEPDDLVVSTGFAVLSPGAGVDPRYLYRAVQSKPFVDEVVARSTGVSYPAINPGELGRIGVHLPDACTQRAVADFLDREAEKIDALVAKKQRLIELLQEKRTALINHAVTKGLDPDVSMKDSGIVWLGEIPAAWHVTPLKRHLLSIEQGWSPQCEDRQKEADEWGVLKAGCANGGEYRAAEHKALPNSLEPDSSLEVHVGDVLMSRANTRDLVGAAAFVTETPPRLMLCDKLYRLRPRTDSLDAKYLVYYLGSRLARYQLERDASGASDSMQNTSQASVRTLVFPAPPLQEQRRIVGTVDAATTRLRELTALAKTAVAHLLEYRSALITAAVTGQIDVRTYRREAS